MWSRGLFPWGTRELVISRAQESPGSGSRRCCLQEGPRLDGAFPRASSSRWWYQRVVGVIGHPLKICLERGRGEEEIGRENESESNLLRVS